MKNDFKVYEEKNIWGNTVWKVRSGGRKGDVATVANNRETAERFAQELNRDPWFFDRGNTVADRNKNG
jgi:hypothetical protein